MIKVIEKDLLEDNFINKKLITNISKEEKIYFSKDNIYYFGNYTNEGLNIIKQKLLKNKNALKRAIENNIKFIISGNSTELFNNTFNHKDLNIYTCYNEKNFKNKIKGIRFNRFKKNNKLKYIDNINKTIDSENFRYKNLICIKNISKMF